MTQASFDQVRVALCGYAYRFGSEIQLHEGMVQALTEAGLNFQREFIAGPNDRFDFLVEGGIVVEAKIKGSLSQALIQCKRYAERDDVTSVILATTRHWGNTPDDTLTVNGKTIRVIKLKGAAF